MKLFMGIVFTFLLAILCIFVYAQKVNRENIPAPKYTIGVVLKAMDSEHWLAVRSSMQKVAQANNLNLIVMYAQEESAYDEQNKIIEDLLNNGVDAILISSCNIHKSDEYLALAKEKNIPVFSLDERLPNVPYIGSDNYEIGRKAAEFMSEHLPSGSEVGVIAGSSTQDAHIQRMKGFRDYINSDGRLKLNECLADDTKYRQATIQTEKLLKDYPKTKGIFVTSAIMALGTIEVTDKLPQRIEVVGVDTQNDAIMAVKNGKIDMMISQDGHETGALAINVVMDYLVNHKQPPANSYIQNDLITIDNADNYLLQEDF